MLNYRGYLKTTKPPFFTYLHLNFTLFYRKKKTSLHILAKCIGKRFNRARENVQGVRK